MRERKYVQMVRSHYNMAAKPIHVYGKNLKIFSGTKKPMTLKGGMQYQVLEYYKVYSNDGPGLTLTF